MLLLHRLAAKASRTIPYGERFFFARQGFIFRILIFYPGWIDRHSPCLSLSNLCVYRRCGMCTPLGSYILECTWPPLPFSALLVVPRKWNMEQARAGTDVVHSPHVCDRSWWRLAVRCGVHRALLHHERSLAAPGTAVQAVAHEALCDAMYLQQNGAVRQS